MNQHVNIMALEWIPAGMHTAEDLQLVLKADDAQPLIDRIPLEKIDSDLRLGHMQLFRVRPGPGVVLTEVRQAFGVRRLSVLRSSGRLAYQLRAIIHLLGQTCREWGCECVETVVYSPRLMRALELHGCQVEGYAMRYALETDDGH